MADPRKRWVDPALNSNSGSGTFADPFGDLQYALNQGRDSTNGDKFLVKQGTAEVLTATLSFTTYGTPTNTAPCIIEGYAVSEGDGGLGHLNSAGTSLFQIYAAARSFVYFHHIEFSGNNHASEAIGLSNSNMMKGCYVRDCGAGALVRVSGVNCVVAGNRLEGVANSNYAIFVVGAGAKISHNYIKGVAGNTLSRGIRTSSSGGSVTEENTIVNCNGNGVFITSVSAVHRNTVYTEDAATGAGIEIESSTAAPVDLIGNYVEGYSGAGGRGYRLAGELSAYGLNAAFNNTTNYSVTGDAFRVPGVNETLASTGLAKAGTNTYADRLTYYIPTNVGSMWYGGLQNNDKGAWQHVPLTPSTPTLAVSDNGNGTATATVSGSSATATNTVYYQQAGSLGWTSGGSRTGDGTVILTLSNGRYFAYVSSGLDGNTAVSNLVTFTVRNGALSDYQLEHAPSQIVSQLMIDLALGTSVTDGSPLGNWPIYFANEPTEPDNVITVYDNPSELHGVTNTDNEVQRHFGIQIRVRGTAHSVAWTKINLVEVLMNEFVYAEAVVIDARQYLVESFLTRSDIVSLGKEMPGQGSSGMISSGRNVLVLNAVVSLRRLN